MLNILVIPLIFLNFLYMKKLIYVPTAFLKTIKSAIDNFHLLSVYE